MCGRFVGGGGTHGAAARVSCCYVPCQCGSVLKHVSMSSLPSLFSSSTMFSRCNDSDQMLLCGIRISRPPPPHAPSLTLAPLADRHLVSAVCLSVRFEIELCPRISLMCLSLPLTHTHTKLTAALNKPVSPASIMI